MIHRIAQHQLASELLSQHSNEYSMNIIQGLRPCKRPLRGRVNWLISKSTLELFVLNWNIRKKTPDSEAACNDSKVVDQMKRVIEKNEGCNDRVKR